MRNLYIGSTTSQAGASILSSRAILNIKEGFVYGNTTEYINIGQFVVNNIKYGGAINQTLEIEAEELSRGLEYKSDIPLRSYKTGQFFRDEFLDVQFSNSNYSTINTTLSGATNGTYIFISNNTDAFITATNLDPMQNMRVNNACRFNIYNDNAIELRFNVIDENNYYRFFSYRGSLELQVKINGSFSSLQTASGPTMAANTTYYHMVTTYGGRIQCYRSSDGIAYTKYIDYKDFVYFGPGSASFGGFAAGTSVLFTTEWFEVNEIANVYTTEDIVTNTLALGGIFGPTFNYQYLGFSNFIASNGSSWVLGNSNNVFHIGTTVGASFHLFRMAGTPLTDYILDIQVRGSSSFIGTYVGNTIIGVGVDYMNYHYLSHASTSNVVRLGFGASGYDINGRGDYISLGSNKWYDVRLVKNNIEFQWYVNGVLANSYSGVSLADSGSSTTFGIAVYRQGIGGGTVEFRNLRISQFDDGNETITTRAGENPAGLKNRLISDGAAIIQTSQGYEAFKIGSSRGEHTIGLSDHIISLDDNLDNYSGTDLVVQGGANQNIVTRPTNNTQRSRYADGSRVSFDKDSNLTSVAKITDAARDLTSDMNRNFRKSSIELLFKPTVQLYDYVNLVDNYTGLSRKFSVYNINKTVNFKSGEASTRLNLSYTLDDL